MKYTEEQESPKAFHKWVGMSILSAIVGRNVAIPRVKYTIYPNLYVILVAGSAKCRKSVSLGIGKDILTSVKEPPGILSQKITAESLIQCLKDSKKERGSSGIILSSELSVFLGGDAVKSGIIPLLTDLYDSPDVWTYSTVGRGKEVLTNVSMCMLGASTKEWLKTSIPKAAIGGGFTSRVIFVFEDLPSKLILFPTDKDTGVMKMNLVHDLQDISEVKGFVKFDPSAKRKAIEWYENQIFEEYDDKVDGYRGRKHDTMFKLATLLSLSERSDLMILTHHIDQALKMLEDNEKHLSGVMESVSASGSGENTDKVYQIISRFEGISHSCLLGKCWRFSNATEMAEIVKTLVESRSVEAFMDGNNNRCYKVRGS